MTVTDIIIPVLNEEKILKDNASYYARLRRKANLIFVDGGSTDGTVAAAQDHGRVAHSRRGRGYQKNAGAAQAVSAHLLFLHADSTIEADSLEHIESAFASGAVGGCFTLRIDDQGWIFRVFERSVNLRAGHFGVIDGDLGIFVRRDVFESIGGFNDWSVMEDIAFSRKLREAGVVKVLPDVIRGSSRKWHARGFLRTFWDYTSAYFRWWMGQLHSVENSSNVK